MLIFDEKRKTAACVRLLLAAIGAVLLADACVLMGMGLFNLGVVLPFVLGGAMLLLAWRWQRWHAWLAQSVRRKRCWHAFVGGFALWLLSLLVFFAVIARMSQAQRKADANTQAPATIIVLGSGTPHCKASPTLAERLKVALQYAQNWQHVPVVVSGGQDFGLQCTESAVMQDWLVQHGLPPARILQEPRSTSTAENLQFSRAVLEANGIAVHGSQAQPVLVISSDFHLLRARMIAQRAGFAHVRTAGGRTPLYLRYNAYLREYFAFISGWLLREY